MVSNYINVKVKKETLKLLDEAKDIFIAHNSSLKGFRISRDKVIAKTAYYYIHE